MKKLMLFAVSFLFAAVGAHAQQPSTGAADAGVPVEEYVPKVIIEGKWGTGPGEFGYDGFNPVDFSPNSAVFGPDDLIHPRSLSVDSKGYIYILDVANNKIQKFSKDGGHLADLKVDSWSGYDLDPETGWSYRVKGINIVIDSKDNLFYYLRRSKDGKESGEVWQFRKDKLVKKTVVPVTKALSRGVGLDLDREDDSLWIPDVDKKQHGKHYQFRTGKILDTEEVRTQKAAFRTTEAGKKAAARPRPKYYLDIETSSNGIRIIEKLN